MSPIDIKTDILDKDIIDSNNKDKSSINTIEISQLEKALTSPDEKELMVKNIDAKFTEGLNESLVKGILDGIDTFISNSFELKEGITPAELASLKITVTQLEKYDGLSISVNLDASVYQNTLYRIEHGKKEYLLKQQEKQVEEQKSKYETVLENYTTFENYGKFFDEKVNILDADITKDFPKAKQYLKSTEVITDAQKLENLKNINTETLEILKNLVPQIKVYGELCTPKIIIPAEFNSSDITSFSNFTLSWTEKEKDKKTEKEKDVPKTKSFNFADFVKDKKETVNDKEIITKVSIGDATEQVQKNLSSLKDLVAFFKGMNVSSNKDYKVQGEKIAYDKEKKTYDDAYKLNHVDAPVSSVGAKEVSPQAYEQIKTNAVVELNALLTKGPALFDTGWTQSFKIKEFNSRINKVLTNVQAAQGSEIVSVIDAAKSSLSLLRNNAQLSDGEKNKLENAFKPLLDAYDIEKNKIGLGEKPLTVAQFLTNGYHANNFESPQYQQAFNDIFDAHYINNGTKGMSADQETRWKDYLNQYTGMNISSVEYAISGKTPRTDIKSQIVNSYPAGTRVLWIPGMYAETDAQGNITKPEIKSIHIVFGTNPEKLQNQRFQEQLSNLITTDIFNSGGKGLNTFDLAGGALAFKSYLKGKDATFLEKNINILNVEDNNKPDNSINAYTNTFIPERTESYKKGFREAYLSVIVEHPDRNLMQKFLEKVNPGKSNTDWNLAYLGSSTDEQISNLTLLQKVTAGWESSTDPVLKSIATRLTLLQIHIAPAESKEKQKGLLASVVGILQGNFENLNPMVKSMFFMISEFFGGKGALAKFLPKYKDKIDDFYGKEFKLSPEKLTVVNDLATEYAKSVNGKEIKEKDVFNISNAITLLTQDNKLGNSFWKQIDSRVLSGIVSTYGIQNVDVSSPDKISLSDKETILKKILDASTGTIKDPTIAKAIEGSFGNIAQMMKKQNSHEYTFAANDDVLGRQEQYFTAFTAYMLAGSHNHFYNVLIENHLDESKGNKLDRLLQTEANIKIIEEKIKSTTPVPTEEEKSLLGKQRDGLKKEKTRLSKDFCKWTFEEASLTGDLTIWKKQFEKINDETLASWIAEYKNIVPASDVSITGSLSTDDLSCSIKINGVSQPIKLLPGCFMEKNAMHLRIIKEKYITLPEGYVLDSDTNGVFLDKTADPKNKVYVSVGEISPYTLNVKQIPGDATKKAIISPYTITTTDKSFKLEEWASNDIGVYNNFLDTNNKLQDFDGLTIASLKLSDIMKLSDTSPGVINRKRGDVTISYSKVTDPTSHVITYKTTGSDSKEIGILPGDILSTPST